MQWKTLRREIASDIRIEEDGATDATVLQVTGATIRLEDWIKAHGRMDDDVRSRFESIRRHLGNAVSSDEARLYYVKLGIRNILSIISR